MIVGPLARPLGRPMGRTLTLDRGGGGYTPEAMALFERFTTPPTTARKALINDLIVALKDAGVWSKLDGLYVLAAADAQAARRNWLADQYNLTAVAAPTFTVDRGYQGDGSTASLDTGFNPSSAAGRKFMQDSAHLSVWPITNVAEDREDIGNTNSVMRSRDSGGSAVAGRINQSSTSFSIAVGTISTSVGHLVFSRAASTGFTAYKNGASIGTPSATSAVPANSNISILTGGVAGYGTKRIAAASIGENLSAQNVADFHAALQTYLQAVGAA